MICFVIAVSTLLRSAEANSAINIHIDTTDKGVSFTINTMRMTLADIGPWMKRGIEQFGDNDPVFIIPDQKTTFETVYTLLEALKASGLKKVSVSAVGKRTPDLVTERLVLINLEGIIQNEFTRPPAIMRMSPVE